MDHAGEPHPFLAMEAVEQGIPLNEAMAKLPSALALEVARSASSALQAMHHLGVLHGDIRGSNILVTPSGEVWFVDLGHASLHAGDDKAVAREASELLALMSMEGWQGAIHPPEGLMEPPAGSVREGGQPGWPRQERPSFGLRPTMPLPSPRPPLGRVQGGASLAGWKNKPNKKTH